MPRSIKDSSIENPQQFQINTFSLGGPTKVILFIGLLLLVTFSIISGAYETIIEVNKM